MAQITRVTSEALQATVRRLLPSQQGFGEDLEATNVITPVIDLTPTAEGSEIRQDIQTALAFGSVTSFAVKNGSSDIITTPGFFRVFGSANLESTTSGARNGTFSLSDGSTSTDIIAFEVESTAAGQNQVTLFDFVVFLRAGDKLSGSTSSNQQSLKGCTRQIATVTGILVNPAGFTPQ